MSQSQHFVAKGDPSSAGDLNPVFSEVLVFCRLRLALGLTWMRLTLKRPPSSVLSYQTQGRCTLRCRACSSRFCAVSWLTMCFTSWLRDLLATSKTSAVSTCTKLLTPTSETRQLPAGTMVLWLSVCSKSGVAVCVFGLDLPLGVPCTQVAPAGIERYHLDGECSAGAVFHDGIVHRLIRYGFKLDLAKAHKCAVCLAGCPRCAPGLQHGGCKVLHGRQPNRGFEHEYADVSVIAAFTQKIIYGL